MTNPGRYEVTDILPMAREFMHSIFPIPTENLMDMCYLYGAGIDLSWDNLWQYRSIHAQAVLRWGREVLIAHHGQEAFYGQRLEGTTELTLLALWVISELPLVIQYELQALKNIRSSGRVIGEPMSMAFNMAHGTIMDAVDKVREGIKVGFMNGDPFMNLSYNWDEKVHDLPRPGRIFDRAEPLQFPDMLPPGRYTHCHGRFVQTQNQSQPTWVDYPYDEDRMLDLPPNVPRKPAHWVGRTLPNGVKVDSIEMIAYMVANHRVENQRYFNPDDPMGPTPRSHLPRKKFAPEVERVKLMSEIPPEEDRTPVRYGSIYRPMTRLEYAQEHATRMQEEGHSPLSDSSHERQYTDPRTTQGRPYPGPRSPPIPERLNQSNSRSDAMMPDMHPSHVPSAFTHGDSSTRRPMSSFTTSVSTPHYQPAGHAFDPFNPKKYMMKGSTTAGAGAPGGGGDDDDDGNDPYRPRVSGSGIPFRPRRDNPGNNRRPPNIFMGNNGRVPPSNNGNDGGSFGGDSTGSHYSGGSGPPPYHGGGGGDDGGGDGGDGYDHYGDYRSPRRKVFSMKPEIKYFPELKEDAKFPQWWDEFCSTSRGTGMGDQIDFTKQLAVWEIPEFTARNQWMYVVLTHRVKTSEGKVIIRRHRGDQDGRAVLYDLYMHYKDSGATDLSAQELLVDITTTVLDPSSSKSYLEFINNYVTSAEVYNEMQVTDGARLTEQMLMTFLQRAVAGVRTLNEVKARERHAIAEGRPAYTYDVYVTLLKAEAERQDKVRAKNRAARRQDLGQRRINHLSMQDEDDSEDGEEARLYEVFKTMMTRGKSMHPSGTRMDDKSFSSLSDKAKKLWREVPPEDKIVMMGASPATRSINSTQIDRSDDGDEETSIPDEPSDQTREVNMTKVAFAPEVNQTETSKTEAKSTTHPGDIRRVLSKSASASTPSKHSGRTSDSSTRKVNNTEWQVSNVNWGMSNTGPNAQLNTVKREANPNNQGTTMATINVDHVNQQDGDATEPRHHADMVGVGRIQARDVSDGYSHERVMGRQHQSSSNPQDLAMSDDEDDPIVAHWPSFDDNWDDSSSDEDF